jgi:uncharacterized protein YbaR (Trm112 family)
MKRATLDLLACPTGHGVLEYNGEDTDPIQDGVLTCPKCAKEFSIQDGIPHFVKPEEVTGFNRRFARMYNWYSWFYRTFSKVAFAYMGMSEEQGRREILDRLEPRGGKVLEVSIGPGVNLPYLINRSDVGEVHGLDISLGQLHSCQRYIRGKGWDVDLFLGNGEQMF